MLDLEWGRARIGSHQIRLENLCRFRWPYRLLLPDIRNFYNSSFPQCVFSSTFFQIFILLQVPFKDIDVLSDPEIRQGIKDFTNWPTIPQLYIKGEFLGGCDIVREMYENGELQGHLRDAGVPFSDAA